MEDMLMVDERREGDMAVVHPVGEIDMQTMRPLREVVRRLPEEGVRYLVLDLRDVSFLDSAGMSILFGAKKRLTQDDGECYVVSKEDGFVARSLQTIAIEKVMPHLHDPEEAFSDIRARKEAAAHPPCPPIDEAHDEAQEGAQEGALEGEFRDRSVVDEMDDEEAVSDTIGAWI